MKDTLTAALCEHVVRTRWVDLSAEARHAARRAIYNWFGLVLQAAAHPTVRVVAEYVQSQGGSGATAIGGVTTAPIWAALVNGLAAHIEDFDDTHPPTIIHPTAPIWSAVLAVGEQRRVSGAAALTAFIVGTDVALRVGLAVFPSHYDRGHHITATAGTLGEAVAVGKLLGLKAEELEEALGLASTAAAGLRGTFGSPAKALHPGQAAMRGIMAADLAQRHFTSGATGLASKLGFCQVLADRHNLAPITEDLGKRWLLTENTIKPFACGVVAHPAIDGICQLRARGLEAKQVAAIKLEVHPRVLELTGNPIPKNGLEGKFSVQHSVAVALLDGRAGPRQYTDARVQAADVIALRDAVRLHTDRALRLDEARVLVTMQNGKEMSVHVQHALGSLDYPLTDVQLDEKIRDLLHDRKDAEVAAMRDQVGSFDKITDVQLLCRRFLDERHE